MPLTALLVHTPTTLPIMERQRDVGNTKLYMYTTRTKPSL